MNLLPVEIGLNRLALLAWLILSCCPMTSEAFVLSGTTTCRISGSIPSSPQSLLHNQRQHHQNHELKYLTTFTSQAIKQGRRSRHLWLTSQIKSNSPAVELFSSALSHIRSPPGIVSAGFLVVLDIFFQRLFHLFNLTSFPSSLAGCGSLLAVLLATSGTKTASSLVDLLQPGAALLAKWMPVFFVPSLIVLPLSGGLLDISEMVKVAIAVAVGFLFTLLSTSWSVLFVRKVIRQTNVGRGKAASQLLDGAPPQTETTLQQQQQSLPPQTETTLQQQHQSLVIPKEKQPQSIQNKGPFSNGLFYTISTMSVFTCIATVAFHWLPPPTQQQGLFLFFMDPTTLTTKSFLTKLGLLFTTLASFVWGTRLPTNFIKVVHPIITCALVTWTVLATLGLATAQTFTHMLRSYRIGGCGFIGSSAGDWLLFCLGPAVISFAISMYQKRQLMKENLLEVSAATGTSVVGGLFGTAALVRLLEIGEPSVRLALLSRNITSPLAMSIAGMLGSNVSLAVSIVVITGILGANFGATILKRLGIEDPVARGMGIGAAAHGLGTAAIVNEKDAFPFAAISMALTGFAATITISVPLFRRLILELALGY